MPLRQGCGTLAARAFAGVMLIGAVLLGPVAVFAGQGEASASLRQTTTSAPGVTENSITVGTISTQTGTLAANFSSLVYGERAYFDYVNAHGGVNGRTIDYRYALDDGGSPTSFNQLANTLINQDHVFAVTGVATAFFSPNLFVEAGIPTYGYDVTGNWAYQPNLFAAGGSVQFYPSSGLDTTFVARKTGSRSVAVLAYGVPSSADACQASRNALANAGVHVSYVDLNVPYPGTTVATDVERMRRAGTTMVVSCMDVKGNVTLARAIEQYGLKVAQLWYSGDDQSTLDQNKSLMQDVYFSTNHVPFTAPTSLYPGLKLYLTQMKKYEPNYVDDEVAIEGWESAALFVEGVKDAGNDLTQANVIRADNSLRAFTAGGLTAPVQWTDAGHSGHAPPYCSAFVKAVGDRYVPALNTGANVFNCFESLNPKKNPVFPLPSGTPAPT
jgi:ABC-type branched-subunit amino acid transport system substrate-binding protein